MNFYKHFLGDYARDTADLSLLEHGAYRVLLDHYYARHGEMPADLTKLERVCGARSTAERKAVQEVANRFFPVNGDGRRHNKRADQEIEKHAAQTEHNRIVGKLGGRPKKPGEEPGNNPSGLQKETRTEPGDNPSHSQKPEKAKTPTPDGVGGNVAVPDCPQQQLIDLYHELLPMCPRVEKWTPARAQVMRARWRDEARPNREKHKGYKTVDEGLAYWRRFFAWAAESAFLTGRKEGRNGQPPFIAKLHWLMKSENFARVIEGDYHR